MKKPAIGKSSVNLARYMLLPLCLSVVSIAVFGQITWKCALQSAPWPGTHGQGDVVFDNKMWLLKGTATDGARDDIWYSTDGKNWTCAIDSAAFPMRAYFSCVVYNGAIWVTGGTEGC